MASREYGLRVIDISIPSNPSEIGFYKTPGFITNDVVVSDVYAYVTDASLSELKPSKLRIIDISTPSSPSEVGFCGTPCAYAIAISGSYVYIAAQDYGLRIINVSVPSNPSEVGAYDTHGYAHDVAVSGSYAYVADWEAGLRVIDISTPSNPFEVGFYKTRGHAHGIAVSDPYIYVADYDAGLQIYENLLLGKEEETYSEPTALKFKILKTPISSRIALQFVLSEKGKARISLYDVAGRYVKEIFRGLKTKGNYRIEFDKGSLKPGVYFLRLETPFGNRVEKIVII